MIVRGYQYLVSPWLGNRCRFFPTCSDYMLDAIDAHGPLRGAYLGTKRLCRCHPWTEGGYDPVPSHETDGSKAQRRNCSINRSTF